MDVYHKILGKYWGYPAFRPLQEEIIRSVCAGKDTLGLMPTGGGKSITFQVPALAMDGICLVITPLIALMRDQVDNLRRVGIKATAVYSGMSRQEIAGELENCVSGQNKFLYVSPERLATGLFREKLQAMNVCLLVIDESHCISQWGYDFRPPYLRIAEVREFFPGVATLALTATATPEVVEDIQKQLHFSTPNVLSKSFRRENISYVIRDTEAKPLELFNILSKVQGGAIVYVRTRLKASSIAAFLNKSGIKSDFYHAGLSSAQRARRQEAWKSGMVPVVVATNAFGMGIDKADVRVVVHYDVPDSPEAYFQEAGRAGRDGKRAYAVLLSSRAALGGLQKRIDDAFPPKDYILRVYEALANYYQLGEGEGQGRAFEFNLKLFARNFKLNEARVMSAISILEVAGFLGYTTDINSRSRVMFTVLRDRLYEFETGDPLLERLMVLLMRNYAGIFVQDAYVDEGFLADQLDVTRKVLYDAFISLAKRKIIRYVPGDVKPYIVYYQPRLPLSYITIGREAYENRKELFVTKIGAMARYIRDDETCRQLLLMEYFGQKEEKPCGICDVCIGKKKRLHREERKSLEEQILQVLAKQNTNIRELVRQLGEDEEVVIGQVRKLLDEGKIQYVSTLELGITRKS